MIISGYVIIFGYVIIYGYVLASEEDANDVTNEWLLFFSILLGQSQMKSKWWLTDWQNYLVAD